MIISKNLRFESLVNLEGCKTHPVSSASRDMFESLVNLFPKNPPISKVFREIGYADELGSGMRNTNKYTKMYSGGIPKFIEENTF